MAEQQVSRSRVHYSVLANGVLPAIGQTFFEKSLAVQVQAPGPDASRAIVERLMAIKDNEQAKSDFYEKTREKVSERCSKQLKDYVYAVRLDSGVNTAYVGNNPDDDVTASSRDFYGHVFVALCSRMLRTPMVFFNEMQRAKVCELALMDAGCATAAMVGYEEDEDVGGGARGGGAGYHPGAYQQQQYAPAAPQPPAAYGAPAVPRPSRRPTKTFTFNT